MLPFGLHSRRDPDTPTHANSEAYFFKQKYGSQIEVLYGGSVNEDNAKAFLQQENISGLLIGSASLNPQEFLKIVELSYGIY